MSTNENNSTKGSVTNPYTEEEMNSMMDEGTWTGGYVEGMGYVGDDVTVWGTSGSDTSDSESSDSWDTSEDNEPKNPSPSGGGGGGDHTDDSYDWRITDALNEIAGLTSTTISVYASNRYYKSPITQVEIWQTASGKIYDSSILEPRPNGKYIQGRQGILISKIIAQEAVENLNKWANTLGKASLAYDVLKVSFNPTAENYVNTICSIISEFGLPGIIASEYVSQLYDAVVNVKEGKATPKDIMILTTGHPTVTSFSNTYYPQ